MDQKLKFVKKGFYESRKNYFVVVVFLPLLDP